MNEREYEELAAEHDPSVEDETREETDRLAEAAIRSNGYEIIRMEVFFIENPAGEEVAGPFYTQREADRWIENAEPYGAGSDPFGRPDPQTHPEFWTE